MSLHAGGAAPAPARLLEPLLEVDEPRAADPGARDRRGVKRGILAGGAALGLLPAHAVEQEPREGVFVEVAVRPALAGLLLRAVLPAGAPSSPMVEDLLEGLRGSPLGA